MGDYLIASLASIVGVALIGLGIGWARMLYRGQR